MASSGIRDCSVYSNATVAKTVLYIGNVDDFIVNDVLLNNTGSGSGDTTGVAMHVDKDPQSLAFTNVTITTLMGSRSVQQLLYRPMTT
jgi:hypothetical protein